MEYGRKVILLAKVCYRLYKLTLPYPKCHDIQAGNSPSSKYVERERVSAAMLPADPHPAWVPGGPDIQIGLRNYATPKYWALLKEPEKTLSQSREVGRYVGAFFITP